MRTLMVTTFVTVDGVMQAQGGSDEDRDGGFEHGGWAVPLLLGRRTYDIFAAILPLAEADDPIGATMNGIPKYVAPRTLDAVNWQNSTLLTGDVPDAVRALTEGDGGEIQVHGSGGLVQTLVEHDLVDEFHLRVFPVLLGSGKRLFAQGTVPAGLTLVDTSTSSTGVLLSTYARDGRVGYGAMGPETGNW